MTNRKTRITILTDNPKSWIIPYVREFYEEIKDKYHVKWIFSAENLEEGDIAIFLSCEKLFPEAALKLNKHNLVVHSSDLPKGKGFSPLTWQILEGKNKYTNTIFEAEKKVDSGKIYAKDIVELDGYELINEIRRKDVKSTFGLIRKCLESKFKGKGQDGKETFYPKRKPSDSQLDINQTIKEQFNLLRVVDNERYPAFFIHHGHKYILQIYEENNEKKF